MAAAIEKDTETRPAHPPLRWRSWPLRQSASRSVLATAGLLLAALVVYGLAGRILLALLALAALVAGCLRFFLPVEFELSEAGISQRMFGRHRLIPWRAIARYEVCSAGVLLLADTDRFPLAPLHGLYVAWLGNRDEVLAVVRRYLDEPKHKPAAVRNTAR